MPFDQETLRTIEYAMSHPFHPTKEEAKHPSVDQEEKQEQPAEQKKHLTKNDALQTIEYAMSHPLHPHRPQNHGNHTAERQDSDHVWDEKHISKEKALAEIEHVLKHPFKPSHA